MLLDLSSRAPRNGEGLDQEYKLLIRYKTKHSITSKRGGGGGGGVEVWRFVDVILMRRMHQGDFRPCLKRKTRACHPSKVALSRLETNLNRKLR